MDKIHAISPVMQAIFVDGDNIFVDDLGNLEFEGGPTFPTDSPSGESPLPVDHDPVVAPEGKVLWK